MTDEFTALLGLDPRGMRKTGKEENSTQRLKVTKDTKFRRVGDKLTAYEAALPTNAGGTKLSPKRPL